jgi:DNA-binding PadR family transcriptional regulator
MALLALMDPGPIHGFELKRRYDALLGGERELKYGQVYSTLRRLERDGLAGEAGVEPGAGSDRKLYAITPAGGAELDRWLAQAAPEPSRPGPVFTRVALALVSGRSVEAVLDAHRRAYLDRVRAAGRVPDSETAMSRLARDYEVAHLEADLRWIEFAASRLAAGELAAAFPVSPVDDAVRPPSAANRQPGGPQAASGGASAGQVSRAADAPPGLTAATEPACGIDSPASTEGGGSQPTAGNGVWPHFRQNRAPSPGAEAEGRAQAAETASDIGETTPKGEAK